MDRGAWWAMVHRVPKSSAQLKRQHSTVAAAAKSLQSCPTLCDPIDSSPPGSPILGILLARTLEWVGISFSNAWKWKVKVKPLSHVQLFETPWTVAHQALLPWQFSGKSIGVGCHCLLSQHSTNTYKKELLLFSRCLVVSQIWFKLHFLN